MENIWAPRILSRLFPTGLVEAYVFRINDPTANRAAWIRYSFLKPYPIEGAIGECWAVVFDADAPTGVLGSKQTWELAACQVTADLTEIRVGDNILAPGLAVGSLRNGISWRLAFSPTQDPAHLMPDYLYGDGVPFNRLSTPYARAQVSGEIRFGDQLWTLDQCSMSLGHHWGLHYPNRCAWGQMRGESPFGEAFFEAFTIPNPLPIPGRKSITGATLLLGNRTLSFSKPKCWWSNTGSFGDGAWEFHAQNSSHFLKGSIRWNPRLVATLRYVQPDGTVRWCQNSMVADGYFKLQPRFPGSSDLAFDFDAMGTAALEILGPTLSPGTPILA